MNQPTWGNGQGNWGQPAPVAPPQGAVGPQAPQPPFVQQPQAPMPPPGGFAQPAAPPGFAPQQPNYAPPQQQFAPPPQQQFAPPAQPNFASNPFAGLTSGDQTASRNPYLEDGDYKLKLEAIKVKPARQSGKWLYIIEVEVLESNNPNRPPGMHCSAFIDLSNRDLAGRHIAGFVTAVHGYDPQKLPKDSPVAPWVEPATNRQMQWGEYAAHAAHATNPWAGRTVGCRVVTIETKAGDDFSLHNWIPAAQMVIGAMRPAAAPVAPQAAAPAASWGAAPGFAAQAAPAAPQMAAPATPNWGTPPAQGWGQPGR